MLETIDCARCGAKTKADFTYYYQIGLCDKCVTWLFNTITTNEGRIEYMEKLLDEHTPTT